MLTNDLIHTFLLTEPCFGVLHEVSPYMTSKKTSFPFPGPKDAKGWMWLKSPNPRYDMGSTPDGNCYLAYVAELRIVEAEGQHVHATAILILDRDATRSPSPVDVQPMAALKFRTLGAHLGFERLRLDIIIRVELHGERLDVLGQLLRKQRVLLHSIDFVLGCCGATTSLVLRLWLRGSLSLTLGLGLGALLNLNFDSALLDLGG